MNIHNDSIYAGLSGLELEVPSFDLGDSVCLTKTYAHLMAPFIMAFKPAPEGGHHPAPWKTTLGGFGVDINAELSISSCPGEASEKIQIAKIIVFLLRLGVNPATTLSVFSDRSFASLSDKPDGSAKIVPYEVQPRYFFLGVADQRVTLAALDWIKVRWKTAHKLFGKNPEFRLAVDAIDNGQFVQNSALVIVSLWGALEALFSPSTTELTFRVSSLIAAFLEHPGLERHNLQKEIAKLYSKRSAAAHGKPKHNPTDLLHTFNLLRRVLIKMINYGSIPSKEYLDGLLFGSQREPNE